ncbi:hypothetical protein [Aliivibrio fischeri]|uniref:hypothetical protein n=1 Tax=Aliivibrio fischeri TaxID=668 RepID=UPI00159EEFDB|nr:hypothetical protein [Aliivibrio fischeri]
MQQPTPSFTTYFQAESFLEMHGYHCENEQWINKQNQNATVVPNLDGVFVEFYETKH